ncbi:MAG TPA: hypothetical protein DCZ72_14495 [Armatimonadetes bacterium]|nr:hypothetical protein [Armatimonadota bacterium]
MAGWYELRKRSDGQFDFVLKAANSETILSSEGYSSKNAALAGIAAVRAACAVEERFERRESRTGEPYFVLKAENYRIIGTSEMYSSIASLENGIRSVQTNGPVEAVKDLTEG